MSPEIRTFHQKISESEEVANSSDNMSNASKSTTRSSNKFGFGLDDLDSFISTNKTTKVETSEVPPLPKPMTRSKSIAGKRQRSTEPKDNLDSVKRKLMSTLTEGIADLEDQYESKLNEQESELCTLRSVAATKDKEITEVLKEKKASEEDFERRLKATNKNWKKEVDKVIRETKLCASKVVLECRLKMAKQALDPNFDKSSWEVEHWEQTLKEMGDEEEEDVATAEKMATPKAKGKEKLVDEDEMEVGGKTGDEKEDEDQGNAP